MIGDTGALEAEYRKYAEAYGVACKDSDHRKTNRNHDKLAALLPKLRATADRGEGILRRLMKDPSASVALWAATHGLPLAEQESLAVLRAIARKGGMSGLDAKMVMKEWRDGRLSID